MGLDWKDLPGTNAVTFLAFSSLTKKKFYNIGTSGLHHKSFTIVIYDRNDMSNTIKLNYNRKVLASVVNYHHKRDTTIWNVNLTLLFTIIICL